MTMWKLHYGFFMGHKILMTIALLYLSYESVNSQAMKTHYSFSTAVKFKYGGQFIGISLPQNFYTAVKIQ